MCRIQDLRYIINTLVDTIYTEYFTDCRFWFHNLKLNIITAESIITIINSNLTSLLVTVIVVHCFINIAHLISPASQIGTL